MHNRLGRVRWDAPEKPLWRIERKTQTGCFRESKLGRKDTYMVTSRRALLFGSCLFGLLLVACGKKEGAPPASMEQAKQQAAVAPPPASPATVSSPDEPPPPSNSLVLPVGLSRRTGDLDEMVKKQNIRALVLLSPISFFYDRGQPRGIVYEALEALQSFTNQKLKTGALKVEVTFLPVTPAQVEAALTEGLGDIIAYGITITPDREKRVAFSTPIEADVSQIIVTGPNFGPVSTFDGLSGKEVYVNPLTAYYQNLQKMNESLAKGRKKVDRSQSGRQEPDGRRSGADGECRIDPSDGHDETASRPLVESARPHQTAS